MVVDPIASYQKSSGTMWVASQHEPILERDIYY